MLLLARWKEWQHYKLFHLQVLLFIGEEDTDT
jgi:hypothetical protein